MSNQNGSDSNARLPTLLNSEKPTGSVPTTAQPKMPNRNETASNTSIPTAPQDYKYQQANAQSPSHSIPSLNIPINPMYGQMQQQYRYYDNQYQYYGQQQNYPYYMYNQQYPYNYYQQTQRGQVPQQISASVMPTQNGQQQPQLQQAQPPQIQAQPQAQPQSQPPIQSQPSVMSQPANIPQHSQQQTPQASQVPIQQQPQQQQQQQQPQQQQQQQQQQQAQIGQNRSTTSPLAPQRIHVLPQPLQNDLNLNSGSTVGQYQPPGVRPRVTTTMWEDEKTLCYQVDANNVSVVRRADNNMINGTKLLNVAEMTRGRRDGILKLEKVRHVVKIGSMHLKGVWIPFERALAMAQREGIVDLLYPLFVRDIKRVIQTGITPNKTSNYYDPQANNNTQAQQSPANQQTPVGNQPSTHHQQPPQASRQYPLPTPNETIQGQTAPNAPSTAAPVYGYQQYYPPATSTANPTGQYYYNGGYPYNNQMYSHYQYAKPKDDIKPEKKE